MVHILFLCLALVSYRSNGVPLGVRRTLTGLDPGDADPGPAAPSGAGPGPDGVVDITKFGATPDGTTDNALVSLFWFHKSSDL